MRRLFTVLACATLVVGLGAPAWGNGSGSSSTDQPITALGKGRDRGGHQGGRGDRGYRGGRGDHRDGYGRGYRRGYRHGYDRDRYRYGYGYRGYYGCGYSPDCDPYYGGYSGGRRYYYDRYDFCGDQGRRYDHRDCYRRDTRCNRYSRYRGRGYYGPYSVDGEENTSPVADVPAAESPSPQAQSDPAIEAQDHPAPSSEPAPEPAAEEEGSPDKTVQPASTNPDPKAGPGTGKAKYDRESSDSGEELF